MEVGKTGSWLSNNPCQSGQIRDQVVLCARYITMTKITNGSSHNILMWDPQKSSSSDNYTCNKCYEGEAYLSLALYGIVYEELRY